MRKTRHSPIPALAAAVLAAGAAGCASAPPPAAPVAPARVFPTPPDSPRVQFLARFARAADIEAPESPSFLERLVGEEEESEDQRTILKPYGVGMHGGRIFVCDTRLAAIVVLDLERWEFDLWSPVDDGQLREPINCTVDPADGRLFVTDTGRGEVVVFGPDRRFLGAFGGGEGARPVDVSVDDSLAWVADFGRGSVTGYDRRGFAPVRTLPAEPTDSAARLFGPMSVWAGPEAVYVSDFGAFRVQVYARDGSLLRTVGQIGRTPGSFARPKGVATDREGVLYVVDAAFENVQMFDPEGRLLMAFGGPYARPGDMNLPAQVTVHYDDLGLFADRVREGYELRYLILVTNQLGPDFVNVYGRIEPTGGSP